MSPNRTTWIATLVVVVAFIAGFFAGIFTDHMMILYHRGRVGDVAARAMVNRLDRELHLSDAQRKQVEAIVDRRHQAINAIWSSARPRVRQEIEATNAEIERVLTPEQREKFEKMRLHLGPMHGPGRHRMH